MHLTILHDKVSSMQMSQRIRISKAQTSTYRRIYIIGLIERLEYFLFFLIGNALSIVVHTDGKGCVRLFHDNMNLVTGIFHSIAQQIDHNLVDKGAVDYRP